MPGGRGSGPARLALAEPELPWALVRRLLLLGLVLLAVPAAALGHPEPGDMDGDGVGDAVDNCVEVRNGDQRNTDGDGQGDACDPDDDNDGVADDAPDNCRVHFNPDQANTRVSPHGASEPEPGDACDQDTDSDGPQDYRDNCIEAPNPDQRDNDLDGVGDACDPDDDEDGEFDSTDNCPLVYNWEQIDKDGDGRGSVCDADDAQGSSTGGGAGGGGAGGGSQTADAVAPDVTVRVARRHRLDTIEEGLVVRIRCSEACAVTATLRADRRTARRLRLRSSRIAASGSAEVAQAATTYAFLRFPRAVKQQIWRRASTRLTLRVVAVDRAGNARTVSHRVTLVR